MTASTDTATGIAVFRTVVFDAADIVTSANFWQELLGGEQFSEPDEDDWITLITSSGYRLAFQLAPNFVAPQWPSAEHPQQLHLDVRVPDLGSATAKAVSLGASVLRENSSWNTLADPAGHPFDLVANDEVDTPTIFDVMFDVPDASVAAAFWSSVLGDPVIFDENGMAMLGGEYPVLFQAVENYTAPAWPDPAKPQQGHLDLTVPDGDLDSASDAAIALGATPLPGGEETFRVFADPAGHPFCLCS